MKTINFKIFEKLKINSINISNLNSINITHFYKSSLKTFDIVKINKYLYMTFLNKDLIDYNNGLDNITMITFTTFDEGVFIRNDDHPANGICWMPIHLYNEELKLKTNYGLSWNIDEFWSCSNKDIDELLNDKPFNICQLNQKKINELISTYDYTLIKS